MTVLARYTDTSTGGIVAKPSWEKPTTFCLDLSVTPQDKTYTSYQDKNLSRHAIVPRGFPTAIILLNEHSITPTPDDFTGLPID